MPTNGAEEITAVETIAEPSGTTAAQPATKAVKAKKSAVDAAVKSPATATATSADIPEKTSDAPKAETPPSADASADTEEPLDPAQAALLSEAITNVEAKDKKIHDLLEQGRQKGMLTYKEIMDALEELDLDQEQVEKLYDHLEELNIDVV